MEKFYTTGEIAKLCHTTKRTVQYYDIEKIICPSKVNENGKRFYSEKDLEKFKLVLLYKKLGLSLKDIKNIISTDNYNQLLLTLLNEQKDKIDIQIQDLIANKEKISVILEELSSTNTISILSNEQLEHLIFRKKQHQRTNKLTYLLLLFYLVILCLSVIISSFLSDFYKYMIVGMNILLLFVLIFFHSKQNAYICPNCHQKFTINIFYDIFTLNNGKKGKYLKCPYCHQKHWIEETYLD